MADIKTGIFAKNVQKRLNRAQEKVSRGRRAAGQVARGSAGADGGAGLQQAARCRAAGPGAASCGARAGVGWRSPCLCARWLQLGSIHSDSVGMAVQWVRQRPADSRPPRQGVRQTTGARSGWPLSWARLRGLGVAGAAALWLHPERTASLGSSISPCPHLPSSGSPARSSGVRGCRCEREIVASHLPGWGCCGYLSEVETNDLSREDIQMCMDQWDG